MIKRRVSPLTLPWHHGMPFAEAYAMAASVPMEYVPPRTVAPDALQEDLDRALPEMREDAARAGTGRVVVLLTGQASAKDNGPWEWGEATGEWVRPEGDGKAFAVL